MKKRLIIMVLILATLALSAGGAGEDGVYFAQEKAFAGSGWKYNVTLIAKDGVITEVMWNGSNINGGPDKVTLSEMGKYPMVAKGGAQSDWHIQAKLVEDYLLEVQDVTTITTDAEGHSDSISGATIKIDPFKALVQEALEKGPIGYGPYKDGVYRAEQPAFDHGYKHAVDVTVTSGYIVAVNWDGISEDGTDSKEKKSMDGVYGMFEKGGATAPWWEQARTVEDYVIMNQSTEKPDSISGASIGLDPFYSLLNMALEGNMR